MPSQMVSCCKDKAVLVSVYVEKPRKKRVSANDHHHHHYHIHHRIRRDAVHGAAIQGCDRRAELLTYSQRLRESAREALSTPLLSKQSSNGNREPTQIVPAQKKPKHAGSPACFGNWKLLIPSFLRSWTRSAKSKERKKKQKHI